MKCENCGCETTIVVDGTPVCSSECADALAAKAHKEAESKFREADSLVRYYVHREIHRN